MAESEIWEFVAEGHTGILTTLRRDGRPVTLPVWYATVERIVYVIARGKKVARVRHDDRCTFLVEAGRRWAELRAVQIECRGRVVDPAPELAQRIGADMERKYAAYRSDRADMPAATRQVYETAEHFTIELRPVGRILNWDNRKLGLT